MIYYCFCQETLQRYNIDYLRYIPRTKKLIKYNLRSPIFNELKIWLKVHGNNEKIRKK